MKIARASNKDINAAGYAMSVLQDVGSSYYPARGDEENPPTLFDRENPEHLRRFYDLMKATLDAAPGWPGRVIGGMCYVILDEKNKIVDPNADTLELHPRFGEVIAQRDELLAALKEGPSIEHALPGGADCQCIQCRFVRAKLAALSKVKGGAA